MKLEPIATIPNIEPKTKFLCDLCDYTSDQNGHLKRHKLLKHTANFVNCNQCSASLKPNNLTRHMKEVHQEAKKLSCKECDFTTVRPQHLKEHISCKHGLVKLVCGLDLDGTFCKYSTTPSTTHYFSTIIATPSPYPPHPLVLHLRFSPTVRCALQPVKVSMS